MNLLPRGSKFISNAYLGPLVLEPVPSLGDVDP